MEREFRIAVGILLALMVVLRTYYQGRVARIGATAQRFEGSRNIIFRVIAGLLFGGSLASWLVGAAWISHASLPLAPWLRWLGAPIGLLGLAGLLDVHRTLGRNFSSTLHLLADHQLVLTGPYRYVRHPMYTTLYIFMLGVALLSANWLLGAGMLLGFSLVMLTRVKHEEQVMTSRFGQQYIDYMARTGRFLPRL